MRTRDMHAEIRRRVDLALSGRSWHWLARASGVPYSTLADQRAKPKFSVEVLLRIAAALEIDPAALLPAASRRVTPSVTAEEKLNRIAMIVGS